MRKSIEEIGPFEVMASTPQLDFTAYGLQFKAKEFFYDVVEYGRAIERGAVCPADAERYNPIRIKKITFW